jgi:hypothetical protein
VATIRGNTDCSATDGPPGRPGWGHAAYTRMALGPTPSRSIDSIECRANEKRYFRRFRNPRIASVMALDLLTPSCSQ